jgi:hypothetical protein
MGFSFPSPDMDGSSGRSAIPGLAWPNPGRVRSDKPVLARREAARKDCGNCPAIQWQRPSSWRPVGTGTSGLPSDQDMARGLVVKQLTSAVPAPRGSGLSPLPA